MNKNQRKMKVENFDVNERVTKDVAQLMKPWGLPKPRKICFTNCNVIDVYNNKVLTKMNVTTHQGIFVDISSTQPESDAFVVDCKGKYLCPGLFDNHVHVLAVPGEKDLAKLMLMPKMKAMTRIGYICEAALARGFTTLRDCGGADAHVKHAIADESMKGPRLLIAGHAISQTGGHGDMRSGELPGEAFDSCGCHLNLLGVVADGVPECYKVAREEMRRGADFINMMGSGGVASPTDKISHLQIL